MVSVYLYLSFESVVGSNTISLKECKKYKLDLGIEHKYKIF